MPDFLPGNIIAYDRFRISLVETANSIERLRLVNGYPRILAKMFNPCGHQVLQEENARSLQAFVKAAVERAVASNGSLDFLHQGPKPLTILLSDGILDRYPDGPFSVFGADWEIVPPIERHCVNLGFLGEVDRKSIPKDQSKQGNNSSRRKGQIETAMGRSRSPYDRADRHTTLP
jgi:hypothetical protein